MDLLQLYSNLSSEEKLIIRSVSEIAEKHNLVELMNASWHEEQFYREKILDAFSDYIPLDTTVPEKYGCIKTNYRTYGVFSREIERIDSGLRSFLPSVTKGLVRYAIYTFGSEEQRERYLPRLASGSSIGCFALTGPPGGSDPQRMKMRAIPDGDHYILDGEKHWITNGSIADCIVVWARIEDAPHRIGAFIVERENFGCLQHKIDRKTALRTSDTGYLIFQECRVPKDAFLPGTAIGIKAAYQCLNQARFSIGWGVIGLAEACMTEAKQFAKERTVGHGKSRMPLIETQLMQRYFAEMGSRLTQMQLSAFYIAEEIDKHGGITRRDAEKISFLKKQNVEHAFWIADCARRILASNGLTIEGTNQMPRHYENIKAVETYEGTPEIHSLILGNYFTQ